MQCMASIDCVIDYKHLATFIYLEKFRSILKTIGMN